MRVLLAGLIGMTLGGMPHAPPYPANTAAAPFYDALVALEAVSHGCNSGRADVSTYVQFKVSFRLACDLRDAAYVGVAVADPINHGYVDSFDWTRAQVDAKFLTDRRTLCGRQISGEDAGAKRALAGCLRDTRRRAGDAPVFVARPHVAGRWRSRHHGLWTLKQRSRHVTASWPGGTFDGTILIGRGEPIINGLGPTFRMVFTVRSARLMDVVSGGELLTLRRR